MPVVGNNTTNKGKQTMNKIIDIIEKARNLPMDHEPDVSDLWDIINAIEKIAKNDVDRK